MEIKLYIILQCQKEKKILQCHHMKMANVTGVVLPAEWHLWQWSWKPVSGKHLRRVSQTVWCDSRFVPSQWETALLCNAVSYWLGANLEWCLKLSGVGVNTLRLRQNGRHFPDDIFKCIFVNENVWILNTSWLKFVPTGPIDNNTTLVQIMAWYPTGDKPLSDPMMVSLLIHICMTGLQWVKGTCSLNSVIFWAFT